MLNYSQCQSKDLGAWESESRRLIVSSSDLIIDAAAIASIHTRGSTGSDVSLRGLTG